MRFIGLGGTDEIGASCYLYQLGGARLLIDAARLDQRVPKTLLLEHGAPTAADKRHINEGLEQLQWVAVLKPTVLFYYPLDTS